MWIDPLITDEDRALFRRVRINDLGFGYDAFGINAETILRAYTAFKPIYKNYFRVESYGIENIPTSGRCILTPNHSGSIPMDGFMLAMDLMTKMNPPRAMRAIFDRFVANMPFVGQFFTRCGQVVGARKNFEVLLQNEELVTVFPEGTPGIIKPYSQRYQLEKFRVGFIELHLRHRAPIIPVAVIGAEEQAPVISVNRSIGKAIGVPEVPVTANQLLFPFLGPLAMLPFPTKYHIYYGKPIKFYEEFSEDTVRNPALVRALAAEVQARVQSMIDEGLRQREAIFY